MAVTERITELLVIISLMGKLLCFTMPCCIALLAFLSWWLLDLSPGAAILPGAVLAPTDPVNANF